MNLVMSVCMYIRTREWLKKNYNSNSSTKDSLPKIIQREKRMVDAMVFIYCKDHHGYSNAPCIKCSELG